jgi:hypothetical protein
LEDSEAEIGMSFKDFIQVADSGFLRLRNRAGSIIAGRSLGADRSVVEVKGWVSLYLRERGKKVPGSSRDGHNIWTNTGREYLALLMSIATGGAVSGTRFRSDAVGYIGVGTGSTLEDTSVLSLVSPTKFTSSDFLAPLEVPPTFPLTPTRTAVRYKRTFAENEITLDASTVNITEMGLYTNGSPTNIPAYAFGTRDVTFAQAIAQSPVAYKTFEPLAKTNALQLEISWEIRF